MIGNQTSSRPMPRIACQAWSAGTWSFLVIGCLVVIAPPEASRKTNSVAVASALEATALPTLGRNNLEVSGMFHIHPDRRPGEPPGRGRPRRSGRTRAQIGPAVPGTLGARMRRGLGRNVLARHHEGCRIVALRPGSAGPFGRTASA